MRIATEEYFFLAVA